MSSPLSLHVERMGSGPPVVLAHGFGGSARNFRKQGRALREAYTLIAYDARGHARSPRPDAPEEYTLEALTGDLGRIVSEAGPAVVGGVSLGAYTALEYALTAPVKPRALVVAAFPAPRSNPRRVRWATEFAQAIEQEGLDAAGARFAWGPDARFDESSRALIRMGFLEHSPVALAALLRRVLAEIVDPDERGAELRQLHVPVLLVSGSEDPEAIAGADALARHLPRAEKFVIPGAGHLVNLQAAEAFNDTLRAFLQRLPA